jgi:hypothetical protein
MNEGDSHAAFSDCGRHSLRRTQSHISAGKHSEHTCFKKIRIASGRPLLRFHDFVASQHVSAADPSWQTSAIKNSKRTGSLFANVSEPFFNSIDPKRTFGLISHAVEAGTGLAYALSLGRIICLVGSWVRAIAATLTLCRNPARCW